MTRLLRVLTLPAAALLLFTGCSSDDAPSKADSSPASESPSAEATPSAKQSPSAKATVNTEYQMSDYKAAVLAYFDEKGDEALEGVPFKIKGQKQLGCMVDAFASAQDIERLRMAGPPQESVSAFFTIGSGENGKPTIPQAEKLLTGVEDCKIDLRPAVVTAITGGMAQGIADKSQVEILTTCVETTLPDALVREFLTATMTEQNPQQSQAMTDWQKTAEKCLTDNDYNPTSTG